MKRGRPEIEKISFSAERLQQALDYQKTSLRRLNTDPTLFASERTIRRAKKEGKINPEILNRLGKCLNVDPLFLAGEYDRRAEQWASTSEEAKEIQNSFEVSDYPYALHLHRHQGALRYIKELLIANEIPASELDNMPREKLIHFYLDIERAVNSVLWQYFEIPHRSYKNYSIPMPPEEEIVHL